MADAFASQFAETEEVVGSQPIPIRPAVADPDEFPVDALPPILRNAVAATVDKVRLPVAIAAGAALATASLAVQPYVDVEMPTGEIVPTSLFITTVGESGERKSSADKRLLQGVRQREKELRLDSQDAAASYQTKKAAYDAARKKATTGNKNRVQIERELEACGKEPIAPITAVLLVEEPTIPALHKLFAEAMPSLGLFSDEGATLIGGHAMSEENRVQSGAALSKLWDGATIKRVRASEAVTFLPGRRLAFHLMVQPMVARQLFGDAKLKDQGLLSRLLVSYPKSTKGERFWRDASEDSELDLDKFNARVLGLLRGEMPMDPLTRELSPQTMPLSEQAREIFIRWHDAVEGELRKGGAFEQISGFAAKLPEHSLRLAGVMSYFQNKKAAPISADAMAAGIKIAQFYAAEALRLFGIGGADEDTENAANLLAWVREKGLERVGKRMIQRSPVGRKLHGPQFRNAMNMMIEMGHLIPIKGGADCVEGGKSSFQREAYTVVPEDAGE